MAGNEAISYVAIAAILIIAYAMLLKRSTDVAGDAGKWVAENIVNPVYKTAVTNPVTVQITSQKGIIEGSGKYYLDVTHIPDTPEGYNPSNWTWKIPGSNIIIGLPAGMTPDEFCAVSPDSPICKKGVFS